MLESTCCSKFTVVDHMECSRLVHSQTANLINKCFAEATQIDLQVGTNYGFECGPKTLDYQLANPGEKLDCCWFEIANILTLKPPEGQGPHCGPCT